MTNNKNDDYILEDNYHGDIKLTRINKSKKITLTKHNDNIKHNFELDTSNTKSHICLTKPKDLHNSKQINNNITINPKPVQDFNNINNKPSKNITKGISMFLIFIFLMQWFSAL